MSVSPAAFRSHLMQQFVAAARRQSRPPLVLAEAVSSCAGGLANQHQHRGGNPSSASNGLRHAQRAPLSGRRVGLCAFSSMIDEMDVVAPVLSEIDSEADGESHLMRSAAPDVDSAADADGLRALILTRRTVSNFAPPPASPPDRVRLRDALTRAVECAASAPNHRRTEPVTFIRMMTPSPATVRLADIAYRVGVRRMREKARGSEASIQAEARRKGDRWGKVPAFLVATVSGQPPQAPESEADALRIATGAADEEDLSAYAELPLSPPRTERQLEDYACACASIQNALLSLHADGIASKWVTGPVIRTVPFRELVGCRNDEAVVALIMVGLYKGAGGGIKSGEGNRARMRGPGRKREIEGDVLKDV